MNFFSVFILFLSSYSIFAKDCAPKAGDFFVGCEGEGCKILRYKKAVKGIRIYEKPDLSSKEVDRLARCEKFHSFTPMLLTKRVGHGTLKVDKFMDPTLKEKPGKKFKYIQELGEDFFKVCIDNKVYEVDLSEVSTDLKNKNESWIKIKTPRGIEGYARGNRPFYMGVYNFDTTLLCPEDRVSKSGEIRVSEVELTNLEKRSQAIFLKDSPSRWTGEYYHLEDKKCFSVIRKGAFLYKKNKKKCSKKLLSRI